MSRDPFLGDLKIHRFCVPCTGTGTGTGTLAVHVAVNTGTLRLTREKRVGYRVEWLRHYHVWEVMVAFIKLRGRHVCLSVPGG